MSKILTSHKPGNITDHHSTVFDITQQKDGPQKFCTPKKMVIFYIISTSFVWEHYNWFSLYRLSFNCQEYCYG